MVHQKFHQLNRDIPLDDDRYTDIRLALRDEAPPYPQTPFGATKTAELDLQFGIDPSFGLSRQRYGWYSNGTLFDSTHFTESAGKIDIETSATGTDTARLRSAYPGQYIPHTIAEPGIGASIPSEHIERDSNNLVSLTHGEISINLSQWDENNDTGLNTHGISYESDATYHQVRSGNTDVAKVAQKDWNIDPMDGTGPSGRTLRPEDGYIHLFIYNWYGEGAIILALQEPKTDDVIPVNQYNPDENNPTVESPNMPVLVVVENQGTADPLGCRVGGMQYVTQGGGAEAAGLDRVSRSIEVVRHTSASYIDTEVTLSNGSPDPLAEPGRPLVSVRRDINDTTSRKSLAVELSNQFINSDQDVYLFVYDEYDDSQLTGANWRPPPTEQEQETRLQVDTEATDYIPGPDATIRGVAYASADKKSGVDIGGDTAARLPLEATSVVTAALPPSGSTTFAQPIIATVKEGF